MGEKAAWLQRSKWWLGNLIKVLKTRPRYGGMGRVGGVGGRW